LPSQPFPGFPARSRLTPLPDVFFSRLLPETESLTELKVVLHIFWRLYQKKDSPKFITYDELLSDETLTAGLAGSTTSASVLREALDSAVSRGALLHTVLNDSGQPREAYFVNTEAGRSAVSALQCGPPASVQARGQTPARPGAANIFTLYEQNIGLLTPMIVDELKEAESLYPASWIEDAFREAAALNKRSWRYIARILERWSAEGKGSGEPGRDSKKKRGPERYLGGRYGHLVRH